MTPSGGELMRLTTAALLVVASLLSSVPASKSLANNTVDSGLMTPTSFILPLRGNVYPNRVFYTKMFIGNPPKPYILDIDTGSDLSWLQCDAPCVHCLKIHYIDDASSKGFIVVDVFGVRLKTGSRHIPLAFGCGSDQEAPGPDPTSPVDGMLGLGRGPTSLISQLKAMGIIRGVTGHCLGRMGTGYLFFGDDLIPNIGNITWAVMEPRNFHYSPGPATLTFQNKNQQVGMPVLFDSGTTYTYFADKPYGAFLSAVREEISKTPLKETLEDNTLPVCWKGSKPFRSLAEVTNYFSPLTLTFTNPNGVQLGIPPQNYLIISNSGNACLGILNGTQLGLEDSNVIGDISMQDLVVIYDNEMQRVGWARANCNRQ